MASPGYMLRPAREVTFRIRPQVSKRKLLPLVRTRLASNDSKPAAVPPSTKGPDEDQLPHVSQEQAELDKSMGKTPPDLEQGTPIQDVYFKMPLQMVPG